jgi:hypothetical protein
MEQPTRQGARSSARAAWRPWRRGRG